MLTLFFVGDKEETDEGGTEDAATTSSVCTPT